MNIPTTVRAVVKQATASSTPSPSPTATSDDPGDHEPFLYFIALGLGIVFTNLWIILGLKYCCRQRRRRMLGLTDAESIEGGRDDLTFYLNPIMAAPEIHRRRRKERKVLSLDELNTKFPVQKYQDWGAAREKVGLSMTGGISSSMAQDMAKAAEIAIEKREDKEPSQPNEQQRDEQQKSGTVLQGTTGHVSDEDGSGKDVSGEQVFSEHESDKHASGEEVSSEHLSEHVSDKPTEIMADSKIDIENNDGSSADHQQNLNHYDAKADNSKHDKSKATDGTRPSEMGPGINPSASEGLLSTTTTADLSEISSSPAYENYVVPISSTSDSIDQNLSKDSLQDTKFPVVHEIEDDNENVIQALPHQQGQHSDLEPSTSSGYHDHDEDSDDEFGVTLSPLHVDSIGDMCAICLDSIEPNDDIRALSCSHVFHDVCITPWLTTRRACCPLCKKDYYVKKTKDSNRLHQSAPIVNGSNGSDPQPDTNLETRQTNSTHNSGQTPSQPTQPQPAHPQPTHPRTASTNVGRFARGRRFISAHFTYGPPVGMRPGHIDPTIYRPARL